eukprot:scaffold566_cov364-Pavlova_lutheri.AAC.31
MFFLLAATMLVAGGSRELHSSGTCRCTCCLGNDCDPTYVGNVDVSGPSGCTLPACRNTYPSQCPAEGQTGSVVAAYDSSAFKTENLPSTKLLLGILMLPLLLHSSNAFL